MPEVLNGNSQLMPHEVHAMDGHAVVLIGENDSIFKIKNSWGDSWADGGCFHVHKKCFCQMYPKYYDVFFYESDLLPQDHQNYKDYIAKLAFNVSPPPSQLSSSLAEAMVDTTLFTLGVTSFFELNKKNLDEADDTFDDTFVVPRTFK